MSTSTPFPTSPTAGPRIDSLITAEEIAQRVKELGAAITRDYEGRNPVIVGVLKGSFLFMADLVREIRLPVRCDFLGLSSYGSDTKSSGVVKTTLDLSQPITGEDVIVVEDIVDTGLTMRYLISNLETRLPKSLRVCSLLHKPARQKVHVNIDYLGFTIPDRFVIGYGLDSAGIYRNLPYIGVLHPDGAAVTAENGGAKVGRPAAAAAAGNGGEAGAASAKTRRNGES
jgi:hypoxanthine phosphoribosyltransferase